MVQNLGCISAENLGNRRIIAVLIRIIQISTEMYFQSSGIFKKETILDV